MRYSNLTPKMKSENYKLKTKKGFTQSLENGIVPTNVGTAKAMPFFSAGFTLMEILVVMGIFIIIFSITFSLFGRLDKKEALEKDVAGIIALTRNARLLSVASKNAALFGIHFESDKAVLFEGSVYVIGGPNQKVINLSKKVYISSYSLNTGGSDIIFSRLIGDTLNYGTVTVSLKDNSTSTTITILKTGVIQ